MDRHLEDNQLGTDAQNAANRRNAQACTGPLTLPGKERARLNGVRHGLATTAAMVLPDEDEAAFERLREGVWLDLLPEGEVQEQLAERAALLLWRLARAGRLETALFHQGDLMTARARIDARLDLRKKRKDAAPLYNHDSFASEAETARLAAVEAALDGVALAPAFTEDARGPNVFERLARHETGLQRALLQVLDRLAALQRPRPAPRRGAVVTLEGESVAPG